MSIIVFFLQSSNESHGDLTPRCISFADSELTSALRQCEELRSTENVCHVTMSSEPSNMVGKFGVSSIVDGRTPDGELYDWSKSDRAGKMRKQPVNTH